MAAVRVSSPAPNAKATVSTVVLSFPEGSQKSRFWVSRNQSAETVPKPEAVLGGCYGYRGVRFGGEGGHGFGCSALAVGVSEGRAWFRKRQVSRRLFSGARSELRCGSVAEDLPPLLGEGRPRRTAPNGCRNR